MATVGPETETGTASNFGMEDCFDLDEALNMDCFDLDEALNMAVNSGSWTSVSKPRRRESESMPTVTCDGVCTVCMEGFQSGAVVPCGHVYHPTCIAKWLSLHNSCPLCRFQISGDRSSENSSLASP